MTKTKLVGLALAVMGLVLMTPLLMLFVDSWTHLVLETWVFKPVVQDRVFNTLVFSVVVLLVGNLIDRILNDD